MEDDEQRELNFGRPDGWASHLKFEKDPKAQPPKQARKKRRRKGQLNDGEWAPGYGPKKDAGA